MIVLHVVASIVYYLLLLYFLTLWARFILDLARNFARNWRPKGAGVVFAEVVFAVTDPPLKLVRRVIPPVRAGGVALDFGWSIVVLVVVILISIVSVLRY